MTGVLMEREEDTWRLTQGRPCGVGSRDWSYATTPTNARSHHSWKTRKDSPIEISEGA